MGVNVSAWNIINSIKSVNRWSASIQGNIAGITKIGFKETDVNYGGGATTIMRNPGMLALGNQVAEQVLSLAYTSINWNQGDLVGTKSDTDYAVSGDGFFMVADRMGKIYYTRDGQFNQQGYGKEANDQGLVMVDTAMAINMGLPYTPPALTAQDITNRNTGWRPMSNVGGGNPATPWGLGNNSVGPTATRQLDMTYNAKKTFFINGALVTGSETIAVQADNFAFVSINGHLLNRNDKTVGVNTYDDIRWTVSAADQAGATYNIGPYLQDGANTIFVQYTNSGAGAEGISVTGTAAGVTLDTDGTWAAQINIDGVKPSNAGATPVPPALPTEFETLILPKDILLAAPTEYSKLQYTKYGSTIFDDGALIASVLMDTQEKRGLGQVKNRTLENSNVSMAKQITHLTYNKNVYDVLTKQLKVFYDNFDIGLNLLK